MILIQTLLVVLYYLFLVVFCLVNLADEHGFLLGFVPFVGIAVKALSDHVGQIHVDKVDSLHVVPWLDLTSWKDYYHIILEVLS